MKEPTLAPEYTIGEIIDRLSEFDRDAILRMAINPLFPMEHTAGSIVSAVDPQGRTVVYLAESGEQLGPLPKPAAVELAWHEPVEAPSRRRRGATGNL
ncbi:MULTISPECIES: hypothetical protein [unclassified Streptomyces]|uniref:hypothetical protein n=1 Tax=unclassified Streptomyces TaxID=2593676 RepID=UPI000DC7BA27|nr:MULTISPECIES: hypothetical protein [unclassified Streptomyces]AWZ10669.1 hypothetical protein DRB89_31510 [Streptomyces sp. ICC4]AWZ18345.1 hypothetical protein DRB96_30785 [Streptomyces sp. ICC1]